MSRWYRSLAAMCLGAVLPGAVALADEPRITTITPEKPVHQWVVEEATGRIFASLPEADAVVEYSPATGKEVRRLTVEGHPSQLILKGHWLVAACPKGPALAVIDLKENKLAGRVQLWGHDLYGLFGSQADNPYVYVVCDPDQSGPGAFGRMLAQVDLGRKEVRQQVGNGPWMQPNESRFALSRDGAQLLGCLFDGSRTISTGLFDFDEDACAFQAVGGNMNPVMGRVVAKSFGRYWALGDSVFSLDLGAPLRRFAGSPVAVHPALDLAASRQGSQLVLQSFSAAKEIKAIDLPGAPDAIATALQHEAAAEATVAYDLVGKRVFCGLASNAYVVDLSGLAATIPPRLEIDVPSRVSAAAGQTVRVPLRSGAAAGEAQPAWTLASGPPFAKLEGSDLVLSPEFAQLGQHDLVVKASQGALSDSATISICVEIPSVSVGFTIRDLAVDRQEKCAVAWGSTATVNRFGQETPMDFALVDLASHRVVATHSLTGSIRLVAVDDKYVYLVPTSTQILYRFDRADLGKSRRVFLGGIPQRLVATPDKQVAVQVQEQGGLPLRVFDRETLQSNDEGDADLDVNQRLRMGAVRGYRPMNFYGYLPLWEPAGDGAVRHLEQILDAKTGAMRCLLAGGTLPDLAEFAGAGGGRFMGRPVRNETGQRLWGRTITNGSLAMAQGKLIASLPPTARISPDYPLVACLGNSSVGNSPQTVLEFRNVVAGELVRSVEIDGQRDDGARVTGRPVRIRPRGIGMDAGQPGLRFLKNTVLVQRGSRLLFCPIPADLCKDLPLPLMFKYPRIDVATVDKPLKVQLAVVGGTGRRTFTLGKTCEGIDLDAASGELTVDFPAIWKRAVPFLQRRYPHGAPDTQTDGTAAEFQRLTGKALPADKVAFAVPLDIAVSDSEGQRDSLDLAVLALATADDIEKAMDENPNNAPPAGPVVPIGPRAGPVQKRIRALPAPLPAAPAPVPAPKSEEGGGDNPFGTVAPRGRVVADGTGRQIFPQQKLLMLRPVKE